MQNFGPTTTPSVILVTVLVESGYIAGRVWLYGG